MDDSDSCAWEKPYSSKNSGHSRELLIYTGAERPHAIWSLDPYAVEGSGLGYQRTVDSECPGQSSKQATEVECLPALREPQSKICDCQ